MASRPTRSQAARQVAERHDGIGEEHRPAPADHDIEHAFAELVHLRVRLQ
jgi:hypothetical protein